MFARTSAWSGSPEALQKWVEHAGSTVKGFVEGLPGNAGVVFLVDREGGAAMTLTLWDSENAAEVTDRFAEQSRASTVAATGTELVARGRFEVIGGRATLTPGEEAPMLPGPALEDLVAVVARLCRSGADADALRSVVLPRLRKVVPVDALWWAAADPATLLFTRAYREELPEKSGPYFVDNEYLHDDVNKWTKLAHQRIGVGTLMEATEGDPARSDRYRDIFQPLGLQDELRVVLRVRGSCWGYLCLHRGAGKTNFSGEEVRFVHRLAPHLADAVRLGLLRQAGEQGTADGPGLILLAADGAVTAMNQPAGRWLEELCGHPDGSSLPVEISALATRLRQSAAASPGVPRSLVRLRSGRWAVLHASWMNADSDDVVAVIIEPASPGEVAPVIMTAYGLSTRERVITGLVCQGLPTRQIAARLHLSMDTVQDHLKSVFDRTGVHSRGELVATVWRNDYLPHVVAGDPLHRSGSFHAPGPHVQL